MLRTLLIAFMLVALAVLSAPAIAADAVVDEVALTRDSSLSVTFKVKNAFAEEIEEAIKSGVPTTFKYMVKVERVRGLWFDAGLGGRAFTHTVKYDTLKQEYEITLSERGGDPIRTADSSEMRALMASGVNVPLRLEGELERGVEYRLRIKAELDTIRLPFHLDYVLFFVKFWDFETDWYSERFVY